MIHKLILKNFKKMKEETFLFSNFDLIVGTNNSGKSTILQALAIWQFCVEQFRLARKKGINGIQIVLPNFTALPVPEFNLLWTDKTDRKYEDDLKHPGKKNQLYIYITIDVYWKTDSGEEKNFCVRLSYQSPQSVYARPLNGWSEFTSFDQPGEMPSIVYVPPFSGLEPHERWLAEANVRQNVGKAQPGSVLRNLLYRVVNREGVAIKDNPDWAQIKSCVEKWFGIELLPPEFDPESSTEIVVEYRQNKKTFDVISGGSGFHQILTLLAFLFGYNRATTILFDEPDAHLHVNLQRQIISYLKENTQMQFLIATHSEEFIGRVEFSSILSILSGKPTRVQSGHAVISALNIINNMDIVRTHDSPYILYLEGKDDERILSAWANTLNQTESYQKFYPCFLGGSTKKEMSTKADKHYEALKQIVPNLKRAILLDYDSEQTAINPPENQPVLNEWKRKNIDNYLLVPEAWKRAVQKEGNIQDLFMEPYNNLIEEFFLRENLTLPTGNTWKNVKAQVFSIIDGKKLLFENKDSLFEQIKNVDDLKLKINRSMVASAMTQEEIHNDIDVFFNNLATIAEDENNKQ
ncbi:MAG: AAA family ATPase [Prevotellaceae bacterium]|jgi:ABC-type cobalamin/Fe3+-siderophores transport system ATPase subunit|nr:AAA family ATPase [Prevotellaceae bacterium]